MRDEKEIRLIKEGLKDQFERFRSNCATVKSYYDQSMDVGSLPPDVEIYKSPTAREQVNTAVDHIMGLGQKVYVPRWTDSDEGAKLKAKLENFGLYFLKMLNKTHRNIRRNCTKHGILYGMFCVKGPLYDPRLGPTKTNFPVDEEYNKAVKDFDLLCERTFPFSFRTVHPLNVRFDLSDRPEFVVEDFTRKAIQIKRQYPEWNIGDNEAFDDVDWWEFWDNETVAYFAEDVLVKQFDNPYGFIPYEIGISGFGEDTGSGEPEDLIVSMIAPALSSYRMEMRMKTAIQALLEYEAFGRWTVEQKPGEDFLMATTPGDVSVVPAYYKMQNMAPVKVSEDAYRFLSLIQGDFEKVMPQVVQGNWPSGMTSGYMGALSVGQARLKLDQLMKAWETAMSSVLDKVLFMVKNVVQEPVGILGNLAEGSDVITLKPTEVQPNKQHFYVQLDAETPEERDRRIMLGQSLQDRRGLSLRTIIEKYYDEDPEYEMDQLLIEDALRDPNLRMQLALSIMKEVGMTEVLQMIQSGQYSGAPPQENKPSTSPDVGQRGIMRDTGRGEMRTPPESQGATIGTRGAYGA